MEQLTPMMKQYHEIKSQYQDYILMYRLGDFYEMFFDDAVIASSFLEITLTKRNAGNNQSAPLCGVPYHAVEGYIAKLIQKGRKVAICEQVEDPALTKGIVKREVVRLITPGTLIDPQMLNEKENNYLAAISTDEKNCTLAYTDITNGTIHIQVFSLKDLSRLSDLLIQLNASEVLLHQDSVSQWFIENMESYQNTITELPSTYFSYNNSKEKILKTYKVHALESLGFTGEHLPITVVGALLTYILETQKVDLTHFNQLIWENDSDIMLLDKYTRHNLELVETLRLKEKKGSLLWVLDETATALGARLLKQWIEKPLRHKGRIEARLNAVELLLDEKIIREELRLCLRRVYDLERLTSKIVYGTANARDLAALKQSIQILPTLKSLLKSVENIALLRDINELIAPFDDLFEQLDQALLEEVPFSIREGGIFRETFHPDLMELRHIESKGKDWLLQVEREERDKTGIKNLKIGFNKVFGYYIEISKGNLKAVPDYYIRKQTLVNAERYITEPLKQYEEKLLGAEERMHKLEYQLFIELIEGIKERVDLLKTTAYALAQLDVLIAFAIVSERNHYVRPTFESEGAIAIVNGRHPVVECLVASQAFIPNDAHLDMQENRLFIITGPNMAGKSTFLRQVALITLMGQMGCFVPADNAKLALVDRIFTRVGASDDLTQGQSTFMVEMIELSHILRYATSDSLLILDEIGRGTSTYDGLSIAWSVVEYLSSGQYITPKTLFATHYHELTELEGRQKGVQNYYIAVEESKDTIHFLRKIRKGGVNKSFGIQVAQLAGLPKDVIRRAKEILLELEAHDINRVSFTSSMQCEKAQTPPIEGQISFFNDEESEILKELKSIDINQMTPMYSMNKLYELVQRASKGKG